ncbi:MAG: AzlD domain-containing protein [Oscillospiraceae bacterium]|nr:AzlD domain-containing protein [Candidatus Limimonas coprohippi]
MDFKTFLIYLLVTAGTTYFVRVVPMLLVKKEIKNKFILSFLYYMPYAVLSVMTIPAIFTATNFVASAIVGFAVAVFFALKNKSLTTVAIASCLGVLATELIITYLL